MSPIFNPLNLTINYLKEEAFHLNQRQKNILLIASIAFGCLTACYFVYRHCCFKAIALNDDDESVVPLDDDDVVPSPSLYCPSSFNRPVCEYKKQTDPNCLFALDSENSKNKKAPLIPIQIHHSGLFTAKMDFRILDYNVKDKTVEFLIECQTPKDPEIEAFWDEKANRVYLAGGKTDPSTMIASNSFRLAEFHSFWIRLDLSTIHEKGPIHLYVKAPTTSIGAGANQQIINVIPEEEIYLFSV